MKYRNPSKNRCLVWSDNLTITDSQIYERDCGAGYVSSKSANLIRYVSIIKQIKMNIKINLLLLLLLQLCASHLLASERKDILLNDNWKFIFNYQVEKSAGKRVDLPHTWNNKDALNGQLNYYRGAAIYQKKLAIKKEWKGKRLFLKFDGVNTVSNVFINGYHIGEHRGGYTAFIYEVTNRVNYGEENELMVRVSNALNLDVMPLVGDFNFYGGIHRDVHLLITDQHCISPLDYASPGVYLTQKKVSKEVAEVEAKIMLDFATKTSGEHALSVKIIDSSRLVAAKQIRIKKNIQGAFQELLDLTIKEPRLWNGQSDPFMYTVEIALLKGKDTVDRVSQPLGLRNFYVDASKGAVLNGEAIRLRGVCRHEDYMGSGNALTPWQQEEDVAIINDMGANAIRLSHYPPAPYFYELLDKTGIMAWSEIPFVGPGGYNCVGFVNQASFRENGKQQLKELIRQNYNHPSVLMWGLYNELTVGGDNPTDYVKELNQLAHAEDPSRPTVSANHIDDVALTGVTDLNAWNKYYGWYGGEPKAIGNWADVLHRERPELKLAISEYGAGGSVLHHENKVKKPVATSYWHPEEWQAYYHEENWKAISERPFIWGSFLWNLFDFGAAHRREGDTDGINDKGLISYDRKIKKDAWWFYKASWRTDIPVLHLTGKHYVNRTEAVTAVKVYCNRPEVELWVNGHSYGKKNPVGVIAQWEAIQLKPGKNDICVKEIGNNQITDSCTWVLKESI